MCTPLKAFILLAVMVCSVNGQNDSDQPNAVGTARGAVGPPGGSVESGTVAVAGGNFSVAGSVIDFIAANSTSGASANFGTFVHTSGGSTDRPVADSAAALAGDNVTEATLFSASRADRNGPSAAASSVRGSGNGRIAVASGSIARSGRRRPPSPSSSPSSPSSSPMMGGRRLLG